MTQRMAGVEVLETLGLASVQPLLSFITPVELAMASTPDKARTTPTNPRQFLAKPPCRGCKLCTASPGGGWQNAASTITTTTVGTETRKASPPVCLGPK